MLTFPACISQLPECPSSNASDTALPSRSCSISIAYMAKSPQLAKAIEGKAIELMPSKSNGNAQSTKRERLRGMCNGDSEGPRASTHGISASMVYYSTPPDQAGHLSWHAETVVLLAATSIGTRSTFFGSIGAK